MNDLAERIKAILPGVDVGPFSRSCRIVDSGSGPRIIFWDEVEAGSPQPTDEQLLQADILPALRERRRAAVDVRTAALLAAGFAFGGKTYSLAGDVQTIWLTLYLTRDAQSYPIGVGAADGSQGLLASAADVAAFWAAGLARAQSVIAAGAALKAAATAAATQAELDAVADNRG